MTDHPDHRDFDNAVKMIQELKADLAKMTTLKDAMEYQWQLTIKSINKLKAENKALTKRCDDTEVEVMRLKRENEELLNKAVDDYNLMKKLRVEIEELKKSFASQAIDSLGNMNDAINAERKVREISQIKKRLEQENHQLKDLIDANLFYIRLLQDGDPENEKPEEILDYLEKNLQMPKGDKT